MPTLKNFKKNIATFIKAKKGLICKLTFSKSLNNFWLDIKIVLKIVYIIITKNIVFKALVSQLKIKTLNLNKIIFQI